MNLPVSILPAGGIPKSRIGEDFVPPREDVWGSPSGLPHFNGRVVLTDGFEHLILTPDGRRVLCHVQHFEVAGREKSTPHRPRKEKVDKYQHLREMLF
jgi:hypothetical protein